MSVTIRALSQPSSESEPAAPLTDDEAFERLHADHRAFVERVVRRYLWGAVVDDAVQETFVQAYRSRLHLRRDDEHDDRRTVKRLAAIARNRSIDVLRRRMRGLEEVADDGRLVSAPATAAEVDPELHLLAARRREGIADAVGTLCERQRRVLLLRHVAGHPYDEIARLEDMTIDAVKATLARGRQAFRQAYAAIAERRGLSVLPGFGLLRRLSARLRWFRDRAQAGANEALGAFAAASPAITQGVVAAVVVGSVAVVGAGLGPSTSAAEPVAHQSEASAHGDESERDGGDEAAETAGERSADESDRDGEGGDSPAAGESRSGEHGNEPAPVSHDASASASASASADSDEVSPAGSDTPASAKADSQANAGTETGDDSGSAKAEHEGALETVTELSHASVDTDTGADTGAGCVDTGKDGPVKDAVCSDTNAEDPDDTEDAGDPVDEDDLAV